MNVLDFWVSNWEHFHDPFTESPTGNVFTFEESPAQERFCNGVIILELEHALKSPK